MKVNEKVSFFIQPEWLKANDPTFVELYSVDLEKVTFAEIELK